MPSQTMLYSLHVLFAFAAVALLVVPGMRRELRIGALAKASPEAAPSPELAAAIRDPLATPTLWISGFLWAFLIWVMVARPF